MMRLLAALLVAAQAVAGGYSLFLPNPDLTELKFPEARIVELQRVYFSAYRLAPKPGGGLDIQALNPSPQSVDFRRALKQQAQLEWVAVVSVEFDWNAPAQDLGSFQKALKDTRWVAWAAATLAQKARADGFHALAFDWGVMPDGMDEIAWQSQVVAACRKAGIRNGVVFRPSFRYITPGTHLAYYERHRAMSESADFGLVLCERPPEARSVPPMNIVLQGPLMPASVKTSLNGHPLDGMPLAKLEAGLSVGGYLGIIEGGKLVPGRPFMGNDWERFAKMEDLESEAAQDGAPRSYGTYVAFRSKHVLEDQKKARRLGFGGVCLTWTSDPEPGFFDRWKP